MKTTKGFVEVPSVVNNTRNQIAILGEISDSSRTYSRIKTEYSNSDIGEYRLISMKSVSSTGSNRNLTSTEANLILNITKEIITYSNENVFPINELDLKESLLIEFPSIGNILFGTFRQNGYFALPEWVSWNSVTGEDSFTKIWYSNEAFSSQYDEYEIFIVPPLPLINDFFLPLDAVSTKLNNVKLPDVTDSIESIRGGYRETYLKGLNFNYYPPNNPTPIKTDWYILIYGNKGNNLDFIKDRLIEFIISNTNRPQSELELIFPDIFDRTEFIIIPRWDQMAIEDLSVELGIYKSALNVNGSITFCSNILTSYNSTRLRSLLEIVPHNYRHISLLILGGATNNTDQSKFSDVFGDYVPTPSTSLDFNRMSLKTRNWLVMMERLLIEAESYSSASVLPLSIGIITRNNKTFLVQEFESINYLVMTKDQ